MMFKKKKQDTRSDEQRQMDKDFAVLGIAAIAEDASKHTLSQADVSKTLMSIASSLREIISE